jgi:hypothetical protein
VNKELVSSDTSSYCQ